MEKYLVTGIFYCTSRHFTSRYDKKLSRGDSDGQLGLLVNFVGFIKDGKLVLIENLMDIALLSIFWKSIVGTWTPEEVSLPAKPPIVAEAPKPQFEVVRRYAAEVTAYTSRVEETDETPYTTASGTTVRWGVVATNALPIGTQLRFPDMYGEKIFVVEDRMHSRFQNRLDIWFPEYEKAQRFGLRKLTVEILKEHSTSDLATL